MKKILFALGAALPLAASAQTIPTFTPTGPLGLFNPMDIFPMFGTKADASAVRAADNIMMRGADPSGVTNATTIMRASIATGKVVYVPPGNFTITDALTLAPGQCIDGEGATKSVLHVPNTFNMSAQGVVVFTPTNTVAGSCMRNVGISFDQPDITARSQAIHYPPAIYAQNVARYQLSHVRVSGAWDGIDMRGNSGGSFLNSVEMGALDIGLNVFGSLDFVHLTDWEFFPFGWGPNTIAGPLQDGGTISAQVGGTTSFVATNYSVFSGRTLAIPDGGVGNFMMFAGAQLDNASSIEVSDDASLVQAGPVYFTASAAASIPGFKVSAGQLTVNNLDAVVGLSADLISVTGGTAQFHGGRILDRNPVNSMGHVTGGLLMIDGMNILPIPSFNPTVPIIRQTGASGTLHVSGTHWGTTGSIIPSAAVSIDTDNSDNFIQGNNFGNWPVSFPTGAYKGGYGPNKTLSPLYFTPTSSFTNNGSFSPTASIAEGVYRYQDNAVRFQVDYKFASPSVSGAFGNLIITGPNLFGTQSVVPTNQVAVTSFSGITLSSGYTGLSAEWVLGSGFLLHQTGGANLPIINVGPANITPSTAIEIHITGFIPL